MLQSQSPFNDLLALDKDRLNRPRKRLQLISNEHSPLMISPTLTPVQEAQSCVTDPLLAHAPPSAEPPGLLADWTRYDIPNPSEWIKFLRNYDWAKTTIGPMQDWSLIVRQNVFFLMSNSMPAAVYFGQEEPTMLYNEACSKLLGKLHPEAMGVSGKVGAGSAWARKWAGIKKVLATACTFREYDLYHPVPRGDLKWEEAYFSWCTLPLIDQNGRIFGVMKEFEETSTRVIEKRRVRIVHSAENMQPSENIDAFWTQVRNIIEDDPEDFPFCLLYSAPPRPDSMKFGMSSLGESVPSPFRLEGLVGLKDDHDLAIKFLDPSKPGYPLAKDFQTAWVSGKCVLLRTFNGTLPKNLEPSIEGRGFGEQCHTAVLYPINRMDGPGVVGFLLIGLNPQRNFDEAFRGFLRSVTDQFTKAAAAILVPEERKVLLQQKLKDEEREHIFTQLAKRAPVGWVLMEPSGDIRDKNSEFMSLSNIHEDERACFGFKIPFYPGDELIAQRQFAQSVSSIKPVCFQFRVQADLGKPADPNDPRHWRCLLANASSEADSDGNCLWVATFLTDITAEKEIQGKTLGDALEMKRKSENFIDMVSATPVSCRIHVANFDRHAMKCAILFRRSYNQRMVFSQLLIHLGQVHLSNSVP
jgi:PAS domain-containing protein